MTEVTGIQDLKKFVEAILFTSQDPVSVDDIQGVVESFTPEKIREAVLEIQEEYNQDGHGIYIAEIAGGFQMCTKPELSSWLNEFHKIQIREKLSKPALETVAIIAYKQPITRSEIEAIRGVDVGGVLKTLGEKGLIHVLGKQKSPGNPFIYGTTQEFLHYFGLASLAELPELKELELKK